MKNQQPAFSDVALEECYLIGDMQHNITCFRFEHARHWWQAPLMQRGLIKQQPPHLHDLTIVGIATAAAAAAA